MADSSPASMPSARRTHGAADAYADFADAVRECTACDLHRDRHTVAVGDGPADARLLLVGVAPHRHEDLHGRAMTGGPRNVVDHALAAAGISAAEVRITTLVRCRPPDDRPVARDEVQACLGHLRREIELVAPEVVVALGAFTTRVLAGQQLAIDRVAGYRLVLGDGMTLIPTYHPADVVRGVPQADVAIRRDLVTARAVLDGTLATGPQVRARLREPAEGAA
ncbi:MAG: uracil-DNA glycosylase [Nitriliruptoraceae bacterium]